MAFEIGGNINYGFATETLIYALVEDRRLFDALPVPLDRASNDKVLVKVNTIGKAQIIYQYWLKSVLEETHETPHLQQ